MSTALETRPREPVPPTPIPPDPGEPSPPLPEPIPDPDPGVDRAAVLLRLAELPRALVEKRIAATRGERPTNRPLAA